MKIPVNVNVVVFKKLKKFINSKDFYQFKATYIIPVMGNCMKFHNRNLTYTRFKLFYECKLRIRYEEL